MLETIAIAVGAGLFVALVGAAVVSHLEGEPRASRRFLLLAVLLPTLYVILGLVSFPGQPWVLGGLLTLTALVALALALPLGRGGALEDDVPTGQIDERDIMFSRYYLEEGSQRFADYYVTRPDKKAADDRWRSLPGILGRGAGAYDPVTFTAAQASFITIAQTRPFVDGEVAPEKIVAEPAEITEFIRSWGRKLGALSIGVTELLDYHQYSIVGRGEEYGQAVDLPHDYAVAFTVEMDKEMVDTAPLGPTAMESAQQYVDSGIVSLQLAEFIRGLGYSARAHIDGNYRVVCPLVARDAGLGEIGRMGLLMTPELGPRVRIGVVTTDLPLVPSRLVREPSVIDFCTHCRKCADVCPSRAISFGDREQIGGAVRWQIDSEACFGFWCKIGTDCARCMAVCPYSHPDNLLHNAVRAGVRNSVLFRRAAIWLDDFFYGKRPLPAAPPEWMQVEAHEVESRRQEGQD
jgi:ferredoxin